MRNPTLLTLAAILLLPSLSASRVFADARESESLYQEGLAHLEGSRYEEAVAALEKAVAAASPAEPVPMAQLNLGIAHANLGHSEKAIEAFRTCLAASPDLAIAHLYLGTSYRLKDDYASAMPELVRALQLDPALSRAHDELWQTYGSIGTRFGYDRELATRQIYHMEKLLEKEPDYPRMFPDIYKELSILFGLLKRIEEVQSPTQARVFRKKHEIRPGMTPETTAAELPPAPPLPDDGIPPAEKADALEKAKAR